jgi:hypothetical protein
LVLNNLAKNLDAGVKAEGILATFMRWHTISGRNTRNPEIIARMTKIGTKSGNWLGVTSIRED